MNHLLDGICLGSQPVEGGFSPVMLGDEFGRQHCPPAAALLELQMTIANDITRRQHKSAAIPTHWTHQTGSKPGKGSCNLA
jgi:hypothetical protein